MAEGEDAAAVGRWRHSKVQEVLFSEERIAARVEEMGRELAQQMADKRPLVLCTLAGAVLFTTDLVRAIVPMPEGLTLDFIRAGSYGSGTESSGNVEVAAVNKLPIGGRNVILVEDIVDTGHTISKLEGHLRAQGAASITVVTLLDKAARRAVHGLQVDMVGFECPDAFVVGYGLDFDEQYRSLPYIGVLEQ